MSEADDQYQRLDQELTEVEIPVRNDHRGDYVLTANDLARLINHHACSDNRWEFIPFLNDDGKWVA